jgi:THO complex subunit 1
MTGSMAGHVVQGVDEFKKLLLQMFARAEVVKNSSTVEPPVTKSDLGDIFERVEEEFFSFATIPELRKRKHAVIETAVRETFNSILVSLPQYELGNPYLTNAP